MGAYPVFGKTSLFREEAMSQIRESYPTSGKISYPKSGNHIPFPGKPYIPFWGDISRKWDI
jgi:hypothetical protein